MSDLFFLGILFLFLVFLVKNTLFWIQIWQQKEYSGVRVLLHLRETSQGRNIVWGKLHLLKLVAFFFYFVTIFATSLYPIYPVLVFTIYFLLFYLFTKDIISGQISFPKFTVKAISILFFSLVLEMLIFLLPLLDKYFWIIFVDSLLPFVVTFFILILTIPTDFYRDEIINRAIDKINKRKNLITIGITGSYGKNSTRDFIEKILSYKFNVLKTRDNENTIISIARTISKSLTPKKQVLIVEIEAYKKGEINEIAKIIKPTIGVLTGISDDHISLFKNLTNIVDAQYELIENLPRYGLAVFNGNSKHAYSLFRKTRKNKILYGTLEESDVDLKSKNIKEKKFSLTFDLFLKEKNLGTFETNLLGKRNIERLLPAIYLGIHLGIKIKDIKKIVSDIHPLPKIMEPYVMGNGAVLVNDTHYSNSSLVLGALEYLKNFRGKKIVVLEPLLELGKNAQADHYELGKEIGNKCDFLFLTNKNSFKALINGIKDSGGECKVLVASPSTISDFVEKNCRKNDVVVFEGSEADLSFSLLMPDPVFG